MRPEAVEYVLERFEAELVKALENLGGELEQMSRRKEMLGREVANLANVVAQGDFSPALRAAGGPACTVLPQANFLVEVAA